MSFGPGRFLARRINTWEQVKEWDLRRKICQVVDKVIHSLLAILVKNR